MDNLANQITWLFLLALPIACLAWTAAHEEIFREPREWLEERSRNAGSWLVRKACFALTCDYCLSHYVTAAVIALTDFQMLLPDWRGYLIAWLTTVAASNVYLAAYARLRVEIRKERVQSEETETRIKKAG
jgi:hypothetical protein